jgi:histidine ammonia-lyase
MMENGIPTPTDKLFEDLGIRPITLQAKEGLALINGTQFSTAYGLHALEKAENLFDLSNICAASSLDAFNGNPEPMDARIQSLRPHPGQIHTASSIRRLLEGSEIAAQGEKQLQDPYAFRCVPQVHGATWDVIEHCRSVIETEINSVTDNPLIFPESGDVLSGGNFHGQPIALAMDYLALALAELGSISERRTYQLLCGHRGLPEYLTLEAGIQSGLMIAQYTAASIVNRNKILCTPASIDSIPSSKGQEDHVSMSANAASKLYELADNVHTILAIEFMTAMRALDFRRPAKTSPYLEQLRDSYHITIPPLGEDQMLQPMIASSREFTAKLKGSEHHFSP